MNIQTPRLHWEKTEKYMINVTSIQFENVDEERKKIRC